MGWGGSGAGGGDGGAHGTGDGGGSDGDGDGGSGDGDGGGGDGGCGSTAGGTTREGGRIGGSEIGRPGGSGTLAARCAEASVDCEWARSFGAASPGSESSNTASSMSKAPKPVSARDWHCFVCSAMTSDCVVKEGYLVVLREEHEEQ